MKKANLIITFILLLFETGVFAQSAVSPCFQLDGSSTKTRFCVGVPITVSNCIIPSGTVSKVATYFFDFKNQPNVSFTPINDLNFTHIYNKPGKYTIAQQGGVKSDGITVDTSFLNIEILPIAIPSLTVGLCEGRNVLVTFTDTVYQSYTMENGIDPPFIVPKNPPYRFQYPNTTSRTIKVQGECAATFISNSFTPLESIIPPDVVSQSAQGLPNPNAKDSAVILMNTNAAMNYRVLQFQAGNWVSINTLSGLNGLRQLPKYPLGNADEYFKVVTFDACGKTDSSATIVVPKLSVTAQNNQNVLNWTGILPQFQIETNAIQILRNNLPIASLLPDATNYTDINVVCGKKYEYQLKVISTKLTAQNKPLESNSVSRTVTAISSNKPPAVQNFNASVEGNNIKLSWDPPLGTALYYTIYRAKEKEAFTLLNYSNYNSFIDNKAEATLQRYCYKITLTDSCQNTSDDSLITCNILLKTEKNPDDTHQNNWEKYQNGSPNTPVYIVEVFNTNNKLLFSFDVNSDTSYLFTDVSLDEPIYRYRIKTPDNNFPNKFYYSNYTEIKNDLLIFVPDAFTPNDDEHNQIFLPQGKYFKNYKLMIFNRWGEQVFYSENMEQGWDGRFKNTDCPPGIYTYVITATDNYKKDKTKKGTIMLLK